MTNRRKISAFIFSAGAMLSLVFTASAPAFADGPATVSGWAYCNEDGTEPADKVIIGTSGKWASFKEQQPKQDGYFEIEYPTVPEWGVRARIFLVCNGQTLPRDRFQLEPGNKFFPNIN